MDIDEKLEQTNTFTGGMNTDASDLYLLSSEYRLAKNLRLTANTESNFGELHLIEGITDNVPFRNEFREVYATTYVRNYGIIVGERNIESGWGIYRFDNNNLEDGLKIVFGPCSENLKNKKLSLVTRWESENNIKLYVADGEHELMSCFIDDKHINDGIENTTDDLLSVVTARLEQPVYAQLSGGSLDSPVILYAYLLYKVGSRETELSPLSKPIYIFNLSNSEINGYKPNIKIPVSILVTIPIQKISNIDNIRIYRISYLRNGQDPQIDVVYDDTCEINGKSYDLIDSFIFVDTGTSLERISVSEFISKIKTRIRPTILESKNDYLFAADVTYVLDEIDNLFRKYDLEDGKGHVEIKIVAKKVSLISSKNEFALSARSLMPGETYRYGIVFYDLLGRKSSVFWIGDKTVPDEYYFERDLKILLDDNGMRIDEISTNLDDYAFTVYLYFAEVTVRDIDNCSAFEIVRCKRTILDSRTLFQGIVGKPYYSSKTNRACYNNIFTLENVTDGENSPEPYVHLLQFACPEYAYQPDDVLSILSNIQVDLKINDTYDIDEESVTVGQNGYNRYGITKNGILYGTNPRYGIPYFSVFKPDFVLDTPEDQELYDSYYLRQFPVTFNYGDFTYIINNMVILPKERAIQEYTDPDRSHGNNDPVSVPVPNGTIYNINEIEYTQSPSPLNFMQGSTATFVNDAYSIGDTRFINWVYESYAYALDFLTTDLKPDYYKSYNKIAASGGKCLLLYIKDGILDARPANIRSPHFPIYVGSIVQNIAAPYGGKSTINTSVYHSFGDYRKYYSGQDNTIDILSGDVYVGLFLYNSAHGWVSSQVRKRLAPTIYVVPLYTTIDLLATYGDQYWNMSSEYKYMFLDDAPVSIGNYTLQNPAYLYNTVYSSIPGVYTQSTVLRFDISNDKFDTRVVYSDLKTNGELIDSWLNFKSANFLDIDTRYGEITDMKLFKNTLVYWQKNAAGVLSVNERTIIQDQNDTNIILGNGDVLQRYDYLTTKYGMAPNDRATAQSDTTLYWWDSLNREILGYAGGQEVVPLTKTKNISSFIKNTENKNIPALQYDYLNNEVLFDVLKYNTLVYSENILKFTSVYEMPFEYSFPFDNRLIFIRNNKIVSRENFNNNQTTAIGTDNNKLFPYLKYVVSSQTLYNKTFDTMRFGGRFYGGDDVSSLLFTFTTPLKQEARIYDGEGITNREYDFRVNVPRAGRVINKTWAVGDYGDRLKGKSMQCELSSTSNSLDFSLQYITTKYRISWS